MFLSVVLECWPNVFVMVNVVAEESSHDMAFLIRLVVAIYWVLEGPNFAWMKMFQSLTL